MLIAVGIGIYQNADWLEPIVEERLVKFVESINTDLATRQAPPPTATPDPTNSLIEAHNFWEQGAITQAVDKYIQVAAIMPNDVNVHYRIALGLITQGQIERALDYAEQAVNANPYAPDAWTIRAWALDWNGRYGEAMASALHALDLLDNLNLYPDNPQAQAAATARANAYLAEAYLSAGKVTSAQTTVDRALSQNPDSFEAYRARGLIKWGSFDLEGALEDFQTAYSIAPNMAFIAIDIAQIQWLGLDNVEGAIDILEDVVERNPTNTLALFWLGNIYNREIGDYTQAAKYLDDCVTYDPQSIDCHYLLGRVQTNLELYTQAAESFKAAIDLGSTSARHYWWAGNSQLNVGNRSQCAAYLEVGYPMALEEGDEQLITDYEDLMPSCTGFSFTPTISTPTPDAASDGS